MTGHAEEALAPIVAEIAAPLAVVFKVLSLDLPNDAAHLLPGATGAGRLAQIETEASIHWRSVELVIPEPPDVVLYRMVQGPCAQLERRFHLSGLNRRTHVSVDGSWLPGSVFMRRTGQKQVTLATRALLVLVQQQAERLARVQAGAIRAPAPLTHDDDDPRVIQVRLLEAVERQEVTEWGAAGHGAGTARWAAALAASLRLPGDLAEVIRVAAQLHDAGKTRVEPYLFDRSGTLSAAGQRRVEEHPQLGADLAATLPRHELLVPAIRHHHERWDGLGYPDGLRETAIPIVARMLAVAEAVDAMQRPLPDRRARFPLEVATILERHAGRQWDPDLAQRMAAILTEGAAPLPETEV